MSSGPPPVPSLDELFAAHQDRVYQWCLRWTGDPQQAAELAQDTFLVAYRRFGDFRPDGSFPGWLYGIARNLCRRAADRRRDLLHEDGVIDPADEIAGVLNALRRQERDQLLESACASVLDPTEQEALHLRYVDGVGVDEITGLLGLDGASGARGLLQRCKRKLRAELARRLRELGHGESLLLGSIEEGR